MIRLAPESTPLRFGLTQHASVDKWAEDVYEKHRHYEFSGGTVVPRADIGAIGGTDPAQGNKTRSRKELITP